MIKGHNEKVTHFLLVNEQRQPLSIPLQPMLGFNIVTYGTISGKHRIFPFIQYSQMNHLQWEISLSK